MIRHREPPPEHDLGLAYDLRTLSRRRALTLFAGVGLATLVGCAPDEDAPATGSTAAPSTPTGSATSANCEEIPEETTGPYPGDGSNGPNVLTESGIVRSDIRSSFGSSRGTADGVPLTVTLSLLDQANGCAALSGAAVYLWHCDREGRYSLYSDGVTDQNYLRGVQEADADGQVTFTTIFPACYSGRWPHIHFEVYPSLDALNIMRLSSPESAILSAVIFNALIIVALIPLALRGVRYRPGSAASMLRRNLWIYGLGGIIAPFVGIKLIDLIVQFIPGMS